ncbi:hypothetical protein GLW08_03295 [Pontibacillus yanchengensis]|uniref:Uncharacterized protein n=2 Tax=Pontibacillus yanchengensis TaxID=462910 RepID=A0A6I5A4W7_9BACI|nr:hypothetical protein [Pontibacillus yanchengensis]MYL35330.1 hypothetical protein [Pontibacillus yanchengensis]MYL52359.1 hypothetical protein [Pontibacillus yanchengensis]
MSLDQKLRGMKNHYKEEIPTSFSSKDKEDVFKTISQETYPKRPKFTTYLLKPAAITVCTTVTLLIGGLTVNQIGDMEGSFTTQPFVVENHDVRDSISNKSISTQNSSDTSFGGGGSIAVPQQTPEMKSESYDYDSLKPGDQVDAMTLKEIRQESPRTYTFSGDVVVSGTLRKKDDTDEYLFHINDLTKSKLPFSKDQTGMMLVELNNADAIVNTLQDGTKNDAYMKFVISEYVHTEGSTSSPIVRSITVDGIIQNGEYQKVTSP